MMRRFYFILLPFMLTASAVSCSRNGIFQDVPVEMVKARYAAHIEKDTSFSGFFGEVGHFLDLQIVRDSILVVQDIGSAGDSSWFKAYSLECGRYLGSFIKKGRGPSEMLNPRIAKASPGAVCMHVYDIMMGRFCSIDASALSLPDSDEPLSWKEIPDNTVLWVPSSVTSFFTMDKQNNEFVFHHSDAKGQIVRSYPLFQGLDAEQLMTHLSCLCAADSQKGVTAVAMLFFPQIVFIDDHGRVRSVSTSKEYRNWKSTISRMIAPDFVQYYSAMAAASDYLFAVYPSCPLGNMAAPDRPYAIQVFNWEGDFLLELSVDERIGSIAYDEKNGFLYGIDTANDCIVRYDLSFLSDADGSNFQNQ